MNNANGKKTVTLSRPSANAPGDLLLVSITVRGGTTAQVTPPSGWTLIRRDDASSNIAQVLYDHLSGASEPSTYTFSFDKSRKATGMLADYSGVSSLAPIEAHSGQVSFTTSAITAPSVSISTTGDQLVFIGGVAANTTIMPPAGMASRISNGAPDPGGVSAALADQALSSAGSTGNRVGTAAVSSSTIGQLVALLPASAPTPTSTSTATSTQTATPIPTSTNTATAVPSPTRTNPATATSTPAPTDTPVPTDTPTPTDTQTPVPSDTPTPTDTWTPVPSDTPVPTDTWTPAPSDTPVPTDTWTPVPTNTSFPTDTPAPTDTGTPVPSDTPAATPTSTSTQIPTSTATRAPSATSTVAPTLTPFWPTPTPQKTQAPNCGNTSVGLTPLNDLGAGAYNGYQGGLYPGGVNSPPQSYLTLGLQHAAAVTPLDQTGNPSSAGKIVLLSIGMSNAQQESNTFTTLVQTDTLKSSAVLFVNGAQGGQTADLISNPSDDYWTSWVPTQLSQAGVTAQQVEAVWVKEAINYNYYNPGTHYVLWPTDAQNLQNDLAAIIQILQTNFPNLQLVYFSSRIYGGYAGIPLNPDGLPWGPSYYAYNSGFAVQWLIAANIAAGGAQYRPYVQWGPYLWADGTRARSDGLQWFCSDMRSDDGTHPSNSGRYKVANLLLQFLHSDPTAVSWYLKH